MGLFRKKSREPASSGNPLERPLLCWSQDSRDNFSVREALAGGTAIFGMTGAGKTASSGAHLALGMLRAGFSFLVCTAKGGSESESDLGYWRRLARASGREHQLIVFEPGGEWTFNPFLAE